MAGNDREPIGRKGKPTRPVKQKVSRRRDEDDDDCDDYDAVSYTHLFDQLTLAIAVTQFEAELFFLGCTVYRVCLLYTSGRHYAIQNHRRC